jgi:hypothetical protein
MAESVKTPFWRQVLVLFAGGMLGVIVRTELGGGWSPWLKFGVTAVCMILVVGVDSFLVRRKARRGYVDSN